MMIHFWKCFGLKETVKRLEYIGTLHQFHQKFKRIKKFTKKLIWRIILIETRLSFFFTFSLIVGFIQHESSFTAQIQISLLFCILFYIVSFLLILTSITCIPIVSIHKILCCKINLKKLWFISLRNNLVFFV